MKITRNGQQSDVPLSLILGVIGLVVGLGSQLWGVAIVGAILLGYWVLRRYPPRKA